MNVNVFIFAFCQIFNYPIVNALSSVRKCNLLESYANCECVATFTVKKTPYN